MHEDLGLIPNIKTKHINRVAAEIKIANQLSIGSEDFKIWKAAP